MQVGEIFYQEILLEHRYLKEKKETEYEYGLRLISIKIEEKPEDLEWSDIVELLGLDIHKDSLRKAASTTPYSGYAVMKYFQEKISSCEALSSTEHSDPICEKELRLKLQIQQVRDLQNELNRKIREWGRRGKLIDIFKEIVCSNVDCHFDYSPSPTVKSNNDIVVMLSDIHYGLETNNFANHYCVQTAKDRLYQYLDKIREIQNRHHSEDCYLFLGGDLISGAIHSLIRIENMENVVSQIKQISELLSHFTYQLSLIFRHVYVYAAPGNHSRVIAKKEENEKDDLLDALVPHYMKASLQNVKNIIVQDNQVEPNICNFTIRGHSFIGVHGDKDNPLTIAHDMNGIFGFTPEVVLMGHKHMNAMVPSGRTKVIQNGSLSGMDNYTIDKRLIGQAEQIVLVVTDDATVDCLYDIQFK